MTLAIGDVLAKVQRNENGKLELIEGEMQHLFRVDEYAGGVSRVVIETSTQQPEIHYSYEEFLVRLKVIE